MLVGQLAIEHGCTNLALIAVLKMNELANQVQIKVYHIHENGQRQTQT